MNQKSEYKKNISGGLLVAGLSLACLAAPARSQEDMTRTVHELDAFTVVANRFEMPLDRVGSSVEVLGEYELNKAQQPFLLDSLRDVTGFHLRNNGGPGGAFGITTRGLNTTRPTVMIDGVEVSNPASGRIINFGNLFGGNVSRVEILKGPQGSLYGANSLAGVINVSTTDGRYATGSSLSLSYGSYDTLNASFANKGAAGGLHWAFTASRYESDGFSSVDPAYGPKWSDDDAYDASNYSLKLGYDLSEKAELYFVSYFLDTYSEFDPSAPPAAQPDSVHEDNYDETEQYFSKLGAKVELTEDWSSDVGFAYSDVDTVSVSSYGPYPSDGDRYKFHWVNTVEANGAWDLVAGFEWENERNRSGAGDHETYSYFLENVVRLSDALDLTFGARHDDLEIVGPDSDLVEDRNEWTWRTSFSYRLDALAARVHGSFGTSFQAPTIIQLFGVYYGNPDVVPEKGEGWDLGFQKSFSEQNVTVSSTFFGYDIEEHIFWDMTKGGWGSYENNDYKSVGVENSIRWDASEAFSFKVSHTYTDAEFYRDGPEYAIGSRHAAEAERTPRNIYSINGNWNALDGKLNLNANFYHATSQYSTNSSVSKMPGYDIVNVAAQYDLTDSSELWLRVDNLLDNDYEEIEGYQTAGASVYSGVRYRF